MVFFGKNNQKVDIAQEFLQEARNFSKNFRSFGKESGVLGIFKNFSKILGIFRNFTSIFRIFIFFKTYQEF
jgi:hypothetical protein